MSMNTEFSYLYRDGDNYKNGGSIVLRGTFTEDEAERLAKAFNDDRYFIAAQIGVPEVFLWDANASYNPDDETTYPKDLGPGHYVINDADHSWHEFGELEETEAEPTDPRTCQQFLADVEAASAFGWQVFEPESRRTFVTQPEADHEDA